MIFETTNVSEFGLYVNSESLDSATPEPVWFGLNITECAVEFAPAAKCTFIEVVDVPTKFPLNVP